MKNTVLIILILISITANAQKGQIGEIDLKSNNISGYLNLLGKLKEDYLFGNSSGTSVMFGFQFGSSAPNLLLISKNLKVIKSSDLQEQIEDAPIDDIAFKDLIFFNDQLYVVISQVIKKQNIIKYFLYTIDNKTLKINFGKSVVLGDVKTLYYMKRNVVNAKVLHSVSDDGSKLAITLVSEGSFYAFEESNTMRASNMILDKNLNVVCVSSFMDDEYKDDRQAQNCPSIYEQQVTNEGSTYLLCYHFVKRQKFNIGTSFYNEEVKTTKIFFIDNKCTNKIIEIKVPENIYVTSETKLNNNKNVTVISGFPSVFDKGYKIFGYMNQTMDNLGNVLGLNIMPFEKFFIDNVKKGNINMKNAQIQYDATVVADDGSFFMISQISRKDIIVSYMDKNGKAIWVKNIDRKFVSSAKVAAAFKEETKELFLVYEDNIDGTGMYYTKINTDGTMSESTELIPDIRLFPSNKCLLKNEIVLSDVSKGKLKIALINL